MDIRHDDASRRTSVHPESCFARSRIDLLESLPFQIGHQLVPGGVPSLDERLRDDDVEAIIGLVKSLQTDIVTKEVVCRKVVGQIIEKTFRWLVERIPCLKSLLKNP